MSEFQRGSSDADDHHAEQDATVAEAPGEINLLDLLLVLTKYKKLVLGLPTLVGIIAAIYALTLPNSYTASAKILPPQGQTATAGILAQLSGLAGLNPGGASGLKSQSDLYIAMLKSRTVADNLIKRFDLMKRDKETYPSIVRGNLSKVSTITADKDGTIKIEVTDKDPKWAAEMANAYVDELYKLTNVLAVTEASQRRLFFERQFLQAKENLAAAEAGARQSLQKGGLLQVEGQGRAMSEATGRLRGQITVKEVQISAMRTFAAPQNAELLAAQKELEAMRYELARLEGAVDSPVGDQKAASGKGMASVRMLRNVKYYETVYELLAKQYELSKLDEARDSGMVQVLDKAVEPDLRSGPKRAYIVLLWSGVAFFLAVLLAFGREALIKARSNPVQAARLDALKRDLRWR